jgi:ribose/xylose/arabinose/galactoside ABC-type transport system permease subunit
VIRAAWEPRRGVRLTVGQPSAGAGYELAAIGAVVTGWASLFGGEGSIPGTGRLVG